MAEKYKPVYEWKIDINRNGVFDHENSNISPYIMSGFIEYGADAEIDSFDIRPVIGSGSITIEDIDQRFNLSTASEEYKKLILNYMPIRLEIDGRVDFEGVCFIRHSPSSEFTDQVQIQIFGKHYQDLVLNNLRFLIRSKSLNGVTQEFNSIVGKNIIEGSTFLDAQLSDIQWQGRLMDFIDGLGKTVVSFYMENQFGRFVKSPQWNQRYDDLTETGALDLSYGPFVDSQVFDNVNIIRNNATIVSTTEAPPFEGQVVGSREVRGFSVPVRITVPIDAFGTADIEITNVTSSAANVVVEQWSVFGNRVSVLITGSGTARIDVIGTGRGLVEEGFNTINIPESQGVYGIKTYQIPPWSVVGLETFYGTYFPAIRGISQPKEMVRFTYSDWQSTVGRFNVLRQVQPNTLWNLQSNKNGIRDNRVLIYKVRLDFGRDIDPRRTFSGIQLNQVEDRDRQFLELSAVSRTSIIVTFVPRVNERNVKYTLRVYVTGTRPQDGVSFEFDPSDSSFRQQSVSNLRPGTNYTVTIGEQTATFTTDPEFSWGNVDLRVNGNSFIIYPRNRVSGTAPTETYDLSEASEELQFSVVGDLEGITHTVAPTSFRASHGSTLDLTIVSRGESRARTIKQTITFAAPPPINDNNSISTRINNPTGIEIVGNEQYIADRFVTGGDSARTQDILVFDKFRHTYKRIFADLRFYPDYWTIQGNWLYIMDRVSLAPRYEIKRYAIVGAAGSTTTSPIADTSFGTVRLNPGSGNRLQGLTSDGTYLYTLDSTRTMWRITISTQTISNNLYRIGGVGVGTDIAVDGNTMYGFGNRAGIDSFPNRPVIERWTNTSSGQAELPGRDQFGNALPPFATLVNANASPAGLGLDNDYIYVTDDVDDKVYVYDKDAGSYLGSG